MTFRNNPFDTTFYVCHDDENGNNFKCEKFVNWKRAREYYGRTFDKSQYIKYNSLTFPFNQLPHSIYTAWARMRYKLNWK